MKNIMEIIGDEYEGVQELIYEECLIPKGVMLEIYLNSEGIYEDNEEGFSLFLLVDKDITYFELLNSKILEGYKVKNDEVKIDIIIVGKDVFKRDEELIFEPISKYL